MMVRSNVIAVALMIAAADTLLRINIAVDPLLILVRSNVSAAALLSAAANTSIAMHVRQ